MVVLGLLLIILGIVAVLSALFVSEGSAELLGMDLTAFQIFLVGVIAGAFILWGYTITKFGTRRGLQRRREHRELNRLSEKLDRVESERKRDGEPPADPQRTRDERL